MESTGSCLCGRSTFKLKGEPAMKAICHCLTCRKLTGGPYATTYLFPESNFEFTNKSAVKTLDVKHESGMQMHVTFCGDCGTRLYKTADNDEMSKDKVIVFPGVLDDGGEILKQAPQAELWTKYRVEWTEKVGGGEMMQLQEFH